MRDYGERLRYANQSIELIERALRQERRLHKVFRRVAKIQNRILDETGGGLMPPEYNDAETELDDQVYFFIVVLAQAVRARRLWHEDLGVKMPEIRQAGLISAWRDFGEHWDDPARGTAIRALKRWQAESDDVEPGLSRSGDSPLTDISGLKIRRVRKDLRALRTAVGEVSEREWLRCFITASEAAEILEMSEQDFDDQLSYQIRSIDFGDDGGGVRYWREWVEARREGHTFPPRWIEEGFIKLPLQ